MGRGVKAPAGGNLRPARCRQFRPSKSFRSSKASERTLPRTVQASKYRKALVGLWLSLSSSSSPQRRSGSS